MIELLIAIVVLALLMGVVGLTVTTSRGAYDQGMVSADVEVQARRTLDNVVDEVISASGATMGVDAPNPPPPANVVTWMDFRPVVGFAAGTATLAPQRRVQLVPYPGEVDDGVDNNGNGLVDECRLELLTDVQGGGAVVGLASHVRRLAEGELPNGLDDNGDGLVDEPGFLALWEPVTPGAVNDRGGRLTLQLTLERVVVGGRTATRTVTTMVKVRSE